MKIRLISLMAGPAGVVQPGQVIDMQPDSYAEAMVAGGYAEKVEAKDAAPMASPAPAETTTAAPPENASTRRPRPPKTGKAEPK